MKEKRNRNAIRSKKLIRQAFLELLHEKPFEKITVTNLVERANLNRSTFYAHYPDMLGIIEEIEQETAAYIDNLLSNLDVDDFFENPKYHLTHMFQLLEENKELYRLLTTSDVADKHLKSIKDVIFNHLTKDNRFANKYTSNDDVVFFCLFFVSGILELSTQWINGKITMSLDEIIDKLVKWIEKNKVL